MFHNVSAHERKTWLWQRDVSHTCNKITPHTRRVNRFTDIKNYEHFEEKPLFVTIHCKILLIKESVPQTNKYFRSMKSNQQPNHFSIISIATIIKNNNKNKNICTQNTG